MNIGFDAKRAFRNFTGLGNYSRSTIGILSEYFPNNRYLLYTPPYKPHREHTFAERDNIEIIQPTGIYKHVPSIWRSMGIAAEAKRSGVELFHGLSGELPMGLKKQGIRSVVTIHDLIFLRYPEFYKPIDRWIYSKKFRCACRHADLVIAISKQTKQDLIDFFGVKEGKIRLVYQGCDPRFYKQCTEEEKKQVAAKYRLPEKYILYVGTVEERKNLNTIVRALPAICSEYKLVAFGKHTHYAEQVRREVERLKLQDRVMLIDKSDFLDFPAIYQQAQVFVLPSVFEGFGIPVLEALNSRIPVITSNTSSLPEAGGPHSLYIDPTSSRQLEEALFRVLSNSELRSSMIVNGCKYALKFREQKLANDLWSVYQELV